MEPHTIQYPIEGNKMGEITYLTKATSKGESLRTTVPMSLVKQFGLTEDDKLDWILKVIDGEMAITIKPIKNR
jgi:antitoxin component of MazEF toxin-antitoxin module